jgi:hemerythrin
MRIQWDPIFSVHVKIIDEQHKKFIAAINHLDAAIGNGTEKQELSKVFDELIYYVEFHFGTEERYFDEFQYEHAAEHKTAHDGFVKNITRIRSEFADDERKLSRELSEYLFDWLQNHVILADKKYMDCFRQHGLYDAD